MNNYIIWWNIYKFIDKSKFKGRNKFNMMKYIQIWGNIYKFMDKSKFKGRNKFKYRNESLIQIGRSYI